jgi:hypothetical protein
MSNDSSEYSVIAPRPSFAKSLVDPDSVTSLAESLRVLLFRPRGGPSAIAESDRRATPRVEAQITCVELVEGTRYLLTTHDLSTFGLSTKNTHAHPVGTEVSLEVQLPDDQLRPITVRARVVGHIESMAGMRMAFKSPSREAVQRLHRYLFSMRREEVSA